MRYARQVLAAVLAAALIAQPLTPIAAYAVDQTASSAPLPEAAAPESSSGSAGDESGSAQVPESADASDDITASEETQNPSDGSKPDAAAPDTVPDADGPQTDAPGTGDGSTQPSDPSQDNVDDDLAVDSSSKPTREELDLIAAEHEDDLKDGVYAVSCADGKVELTADAKGSKLAASEDDAAQEWRVEHDEDGYVLIFSGKYVFGLKEWKKEPEAGIQASLLTGDGSADSSKWIAVKASDGSYRLLSAQDWHYSLGTQGDSTDAGATVQLCESGDDASSQTWSFTDYETAYRGKLDAMAKENANVLTDGTYAIAAGSVSSRKVLDVSGASKSSKANVQIYSSTPPARSAGTSSMTETGTSPSKTPTAVLCSTCVTVKPMPVKTCGSTPQVQTPPIGLRNGS